MVPPLGDFRLSIVNKFSSASVALILAIPAGFLSYLLVDAMLIHFRNMATVMRILTCVTLAFSALGTVLPVGIVIFTKTETEEDAETETDEDAKKGEEEDGEKGEEEAADESDGLIPSDDGDPVPDEEPSVVIDAFKDAEPEPIARPEAEEADEDMEKSVVIDTTEMFDDDIYESEIPEDDDLALDVEDEEPEPEPQKKGKKKKKK